MIQATGKEFGRLGVKVVSTVLSETFRSFFVLWSYTAGSADKWKSADPIPRTTRKRMRRFRRDDVEGADIIVAMELLPKRSQKKQVLALRSTATKHLKPSKPGKQEIDELAHHSNVEPIFDDKQAGVVPSVFKLQAPFEENVCSE